MAVTVSVQVVFSWLRGGLQWVAMGWQWMVVDAVDAVAA